MVTVFIRRLGLRKKYPWGFSGFQDTENLLRFKEGGSVFFRRGWDGTAWNAHIALNLVLPLHQPNINRPSRISQIFLPHRRKNFI